MDQKTQRSRAFPPTLCHGVARIFLTAPLSYDAVALHRGQCEQLLRYVKLAASSLPKGQLTELREFLACWGDIMLPHTSLLCHTPRSPVEDEELSTNCLHNHYCAHFPAA